MRPAGGPAKGVNTLRPSHGSLSVKNRVDRRHRTGHAVASAGEAAVLAMEKFETEAASMEEDIDRLANLTMVLPLNSRRSWTNWAPKLAFYRYLVRYPPSRMPLPTFSRKPVLALMAKLAADQDDPPMTMATAVAMRHIRLKVIGALLDALADYHDDELRTITVVKPSWRFTPERLSTLSAKSLKVQFEGDLKRTGTYRYPGPLVAFLHGEWEPTHGVYVLHYHIVTTRAKAAYMLAEFRKLPATFGATPYVLRPLRSSNVKDRTRQLTYLLKRYWPQRALRWIDGRWVRDRRFHRISEPYSSAYLLWLDRHRLLDLTIMNGTWSMKRGGSAEWKRFYLLVTEHGRTKPANVGWRAVWGQLRA